MARSYRRAGHALVSITFEDWVRDTDEMIATAYSMVNAQWSLPETLPSAAMLTAGGSDAP